MIDCFLPFGDLVGSDHDHFHRGDCSSPLGMDMM